METFWQTFWNKGDLADFLDELVERKVLTTDIWIVPTKDNEYTVFFRAHHNILPKKSSYSTSYSTY